MRRMDRMKDLSRGYRAQHDQVAPPGVRLPKLTSTGGAAGGAGGGEEAQSFRLLARAAMAAAASAPCSR